MDVGLGGETVLTGPATLRVASTPLIAAEVGELLGVSLGDGVGSCDGRAVGDAVGLGEGANVVTLVGLAVGLREGWYVGEPVAFGATGMFVGDHVGASVSTRIEVTSSGQAAEPAVRVQLYVSPSEPEEASETMRSAIAAGNAAEGSERSDKTSMSTDTLAPWMAKTCSRVTGMR